MSAFEPGKLADAARAAAVGDAPERLAARALVSALERNGGDERDAATRAFAELLGEMSRSYFGQEWAAEHECSTWARLTDDRRAWGYGSDEELAPIRWLVEQSGCWFDGRTLLSLEEWRPRFEEWAEAQAALVRRMTPGALQPPAAIEGEGNSAAP